MPGVPKGGQRVPGSGRKKGVPNHVTKDIREAFKLDAEKVKPELLRIALKGKLEATRVMAIKEIFDRAFGKAPAALVTPEGKQVDRMIIQFRSEDE